MSTFTTAVQSFLRDEGGVTAIEYGLIAAMIATALITVLTTVQDGLEATFTDVANALNT